MVGNDEQQKFLENNIGKKISLRRFLNFNNCLKLFTLYIWLEFKIDKSKVFNLNT